MTIAQAMKDAMSAYQEELKKLPVKKVRTDDEFTRFYGRKLLLEECNYSGHEPEVKEPHRFPGRPTAEPKYNCQRCYLEVQADDLVDGKLPRHARMLYDNEQAEAVYDCVAALVGLDSWHSDDASSGRAAVREARRAQTQSGRLAAGLPFLTAALIKREASVGVEKAVAELLSFSPGMKLHDDMEPDFPFFSEGTLYELCGKDVARSILAMTRDLAAVTGYTGETG